MSSQPAIICLGLLPELPGGRTLPESAEARQRFPRSAVGAWEPMNILERTDSTTLSSLALPPARIYVLTTPQVKRRGSSDETPRLLR